MRTEHRFDAPGPFTADRVPIRQRYELHNGHPNWCAPTGERHAGGSTRPTRDEAALDGWFRIAAAAAPGATLPVPD